MVLGFFPSRSQRRRQPRTTADGFQVEVESVAYIVCNALGLDSGSYSFPYVARWVSGDADLIKTTAERIIACAKEMLTAWEVLPRWPQAS